MDDYTIFRFGPIGSQGNASMKDLLGGKGANLCEMASQGLSVPEGLLIPTTYCKDYVEADDYDRTVIVNNLAESALAITAGVEMDEGGLCLWSVRSGAPISMPGMMDTILNIGMSVESFEYFSEKFGYRMALDTTRRLLEMYGTTVTGIKKLEFDKAMDSVKQYKYGNSEPPVADSDMNKTHLENLIKKYGEIYVNNGYLRPTRMSKLEQLKGAIRAVLESWDSPRAKLYREKNGIPDDLGTAVVVQRMVFGNVNDQSCSGVYFTRDPSTGWQTPVGEYLPNAQGEDVVAGTRTPRNIFDAKEGLSKWNVAVYDELLSIGANLEAMYKDMQDIEFTVEDGKLFILQTRNAKRSALAKFQVAYDLVMDETITLSEAKSRVNYHDYRALTNAKLNEESLVGLTLVGKGTPASAGYATGVAALTPEQAVEYEKLGIDCILVRKETSPDDLHGMYAAKGILTTSGGETSHAAVVARGMNKPCIVGAGDLVVKANYVEAGGDVILEGQQISIDCNTGAIYLGKFEVIEGEVSDVVNEYIGLLNGNEDDEIIDLEGGVPPGQMPKDVTVLLPNEVTESWVDRLYKLASKVDGDVVIVPPATGVYHKEPDHILLGLGGKVNADYTSTYKQIEDVTSGWAPVMLAKLVFVDYVVAQGSYIRSIGTLKSLSDLGWYTYLSDAPLFDKLSGADREGIKQLLKKAGVTKRTVPTHAPLEHKLIELLGVG